MHLEKQTRVRKAQSSVGETLAVILKGATNSCQVHKGIWYKLYSGVSLTVNIPTVSFIPAEQ